MFDGMKAGEPMAVRALSTFNVARNCFNIDFRGNIRKNNLLNTIYETLSDAPTDPSLSLCTAALLYIISIDDKLPDFPKSSIELLIKILKSEESKLQGNYKSTKSLDNFRKKMSELFHKELTSIEFLDLDNLTASDLVHEVSSGQNTKSNYLDGSFHLIFSIFKENRLLAQNHNFLNLLIVTF